jgi:hypothetical protein
MAWKTGQLHICDGVVVDVVVQLCKPEKERRQQLGHALPEPQTVKAMVDTGASRSLVDRSILQNNLGLSSTDRGEVRALTGGMMQFDEYTVDLSMSGEGFTRSWNPWVVGERDLTHFGYKAIIGRDILAHCLLVYDGKRKTFALSFWEDTCATQ